MSLSIYSILNHVDVHCMIHTHTIIYTGVSQSNYNLCLIILSIIIEIIKYLFRYFEMCEILGCKDVIICQIYYELRLIPEIPIKITTTSKKVYATTCENAQKST